MIKRIKIQEKRTMTREEFITLSKDHILYLDGATGSNLVKAGMPSGDIGRRDRNESAESRNAGRGLPGAVDSGT